MVEDVEVGVSNNQPGETIKASETRTPRKFTRMMAALIPYAETWPQRKSNADALDKIKAFPEVFSLFGFHELFLQTLYKALLIEFVGTASFVYIHIAIIAACGRYAYPPLQIGIAHAFLLALFIYQFAMSSGAHFNSMITFSSILTAHIPLVRGILYIMVQIFGAAVGAEIMRQSISDDVVVSTHLGGCSMGPLDPNQALAIEFFFSLALLYPVYGTAFNLRQREIYGPVLPPILVGITLGLVIFSSASLAPPPFTGAGANPSLCLGTAWAYSRSHLPGSSDVLNYHWVYWVGPVLASIVNAAMYAFAPPHHHDAGVLSAEENSEVKKDS